MTSVGVREWAHSLLSKKLPEGDSPSPTAVAPGEVSGDKV